MGARAGEGEGEGEGEGTQRRCNVTVPASVSASTIIVGGSDDADAECYTLLSDALANVEADDQFFVVNGAQVLLTGDGDIDVTGVTIEGESRDGVRISAISPVFDVDAGLTLRHLTVDGDGTSAITGSADPAAGATLTIDDVQMTSGTVAISLLNVALQATDVFLETDADVDVEHQNGAVTNSIDTFNVDRATVLFRGAADVALRNGAFTVEAARNLKLHTTGEVSVDTVAFTGGSCGSGVVIEAGVVTLRRLTVSSLPCAAVRVDDAVGSVSLDLGRPGDPGSSDLSGSSPNLEIVALDDASSTRTVSAIGNTWSTDAPSCVSDIVTPTSNPLGISVAWGDGGETCP